MRSRNSGPRSNAWSVSKLTNQTPFDPFLEEANIAYDRYYDECLGAEKPLVRKIATHPSFIMPVTASEVEAVLATIPDRFIESLNGVFLLGGTNKQLKASRHMVYGMYRFPKIYLHAFPLRRLKTVYKTSPKPSNLIEIKRTGAQITERNGECVVEFNQDSLRTFYLRDVLMHEIGHHVDRKNQNKKPLWKEEGFAEWFATEYGFRLSS
jgi:hypothetical protein